MSAQEETRKNVRLRSPGQPFYAFLIFFCSSIFSTAGPGGSRGSFCMLQPLSLSFSLSVSLCFSLFFFLFFLAPMSGRWGTLGQEHVCVSEYRWRTRAGRLEKESQATELRSQAVEQSSELSVFFFFPACCFGLSK